MCHGVKKQCLESTVRWHQWRTILTMKACERDRDEVGVDHMLVGVLVSVGKRICCAIRECLKTRLRKWTVVG